MKYNRAFIKRNEISLPLLKDVDGGDGDDYWLLESEESFHGLTDGKFFYFKDSRIRYPLVLPISCVSIEFTEEMET